MCMGCLHHIGLTCFCQKILSQLFLYFKKHLQIEIIQLYISKVALKVGCHGSKLNI